LRARETLFERPLKRPLDDVLRAAIHREAEERLRHVPVPAHAGWHEGGSEYAVRSHLVSFIASFTRETLVVTVELSFAGRLLATEANRRRAVEAISTVMDGLGL
jgi:hypothetical protein